MNTRNSTRPNAEALMAKALARWEGEGGAVTPLDQGLDDLDRVRFRNIHRGDSATLTQGKAVRGQASRGEA